VRFQGALVREQGVTFAIVIVKEHILNVPSQAKSAIRSFQPLFPQAPIVLMAQDARGRPAYYGRHDLVNFLSRVSLSTIPWKEYTTS
jgi:hypothetical protein